MCVPGHRIYSELLKYNSRNKLIDYSLFKILILYLRDMTV